MQVALTPKREKESFTNSVTGARNGDPGLYKVRGEIRSVHTMHYEYCTTSSEEADRCPVKH